MSEQCPTTPAGVEHVDKVAGLFERSGIDPDNVEQINRVNLWQGFYKDSEGEAHTVDMAAVQITPKPAGGAPSFLSEAAPTIIRPSRSKARASHNQLAADIPDLQYSWRRLPDGSLAPTHDPAAMDVALQIIKDQQPNLIILGGDELDLPELSRFPADSRHFVDTLQISLDGLHNYLAQLRCDNPNARIVSLDSNHIRRIGRMMLQNAMPLFGVRRANMPDEWPVMTYANLMRLDDLEIEFDSGYPATEFPINDRLRTVHGDRSNARGSTAAQYLPYRETSLLFHHTHRAESLTRTTPSGKKISAFSFGSLCDNNGSVPAYGSSVTDKGEVVPHVMNWQTGIGFIEYNHGDRPFAPHAVAIDPHEGHVAVFNGKEYRPKAASLAIA